MTEDNIRKISLQEAWELPWVCWNLTKDNYSHALGAALTLIACNLLTIIPFIGITLKAFLSIYLVCGILGVCRQWEAKKTTKFSQFFDAFTDRPTFNRILQFAGFNVLLSLGVYYTSEFSGQFPTFISLIFTLASFLLMILQGTLSTLGTALIYFHKDITIKQAVLLTFKIYGKNVLPILLAGFVVLAILGVSTVLLIFPLIFFALPLIVPYNYYFYRSTCEGLTLQSDKDLKEVSPS